MSQWTRRDLLKSGMAASVAAASPAAQQASPSANQAAASTPSADHDRHRLLLDFGWRFHLGHASDPAKDFSLGTGGETYAKSGNMGVAPARANFDDSAWAPVDLPHDWAIELPFTNDHALVARGCYPLGREYPATSIGWYRRVFDLPAADLGRRLALEFDGVYRNSIVMFNGHYLGVNFSGYAPFRYDVTDVANYGGKNVLLVRVDATLGDGWFYEGAGIYRHVWLTKTNPVHVAHWGTFIRSEVRSDGAAVRITTEVDNETDATSNCRVISRIVDAKGDTVGTATATPVAIPARGRSAFEQEVTVASPSLWSVEEPNLYTLHTVLESAGAEIDRYETPFGIRSLRFDAERGFFLNGKPVKIKGTCNHQDHGGVGAALPDRLQYYRVLRLKEMGSNALRTSHNPPTPELMDACDKLGMLVMCETRMMDSTPEGISQVERMVRCHRNHPSIVIWSLGNEEPEQGTERGARVVATMKRRVARLDASRPTTVAMNNASSWGKGASTVVDVQGFNYDNPRTDDYHKNHPRHPSIGTETASTVCTRGIYANDKEKGYVSAYDVNFPSWACTAETWWKHYDARPYLAGGFAWTGFDYRGEPTPSGWPCINSHFGIMDMCGFPKDNFFYYQAWWGSKPVLHLFPHWNWPGKEGQEIEVWAHTNLERVELFLNGQSLGSRNVERNGHAAWKVKYAPGAIEARGFKGGQQVLAEKRETTGAPARIVLSADRDRLAANGEDVAVVTVQVVDQQGRLVPVAGNEITFQVSGSASLLGVANGDPSCHESDKGPKRSAFNGLAMALVKAGKQPGDIRVSATSPGLEGAGINLSGTYTPPRPAID